jgi:hypothetical protein
MKKELSLPSLKPLVDVLKRSNFTIFLVVVVCALIFAVMMLNNIVDQASSVSPGGSNNQAQGPSTVFDTETIENLNALKTSTQNSPPATPSSRVNPFR